MQADIGLIGLAVMGQNLVLNMIDHGYTVAVYNRTVEKVDKFVAMAQRGEKLIGCHSIEELVRSLKKPRIILLMVKSGKPVDDFINKLVPHLEPDDIIIDGGNSHFSDTIRRTQYLEKKGLRFIGTGISGGEEGARYGPSIMPGGSTSAWPVVKDIFQNIAAKVNGTPCCEWIGPNGAGHFVKTIHNGIEYAVMQAISETYHIMHDLLDMTADEMSNVFNDWNQDKLQSYLIEITRDILKVKDEDGTPLVEKILDTAGQKGTGKWTAQSALDLGTPGALLATAVFQRYISARKETRVTASEMFSEQTSKSAHNNLQNEKNTFLKDLKDALYATVLLAYDQGFILLHEASKEYNWNLNLATIATIWRGGCIIRAQFLDKIKEAYNNDPNLQHIIFDPYFQSEITASISALRRVASKILTFGIPIPAMTEALAYFDSLTTARLPANLIQAQRDYFGSHTYERIDKPRGQFFHTEWKKLAQQG